MDYVGGASVAGRELKSSNTWYYLESSGHHRGTDSYVFSALPGGYYYRLAFGRALYESYWWTAGEFGSASAYSQDVDYTSPYAYTYIYENYRGFSVRCVQN